ncbi:hypothetical protein [Pseudaestuariivita sp.]|uniref:hypothetical protein n=1 Tax=Pseudaestuariivita sp. TaxID=2211669 RepID=UPI004059C503
MAHLEHESESIKRLRAEIADGREARRTYVALLVALVMLSAATLLGSYLFHTIF